MSRVNFQRFVTGDEEGPSVMFSADTRNPLGTLSVFDGDAPMTSEIILSKRDAARLAAALSKFAGADPDSLKVARAIITKVTEYETPGGNRRSGFKDFISGMIESYRVMHDIRDNGLALEAARNEVRNAT